MTTDVKMRFSPNVLEDSEWPLFSANRLIEGITAPKPIGVIEVIGHLSPTCRDLTMATNAAGTAAMSLFEKLESSGYRLWAFIAHGAWQPGSQCIRLRRSWTTSPRLAQFSFGIASDEVIFETSGMVRLACARQIPTDGILSILETARIDEACVLIASTREDFCTEGNIRDVFTYAFPIITERAQERIEWASLVLGLCPKRDVVVRVTGLFDDQEASIDLFGEADILANVQ